ncbi:hypothetical protein HRbin19_01278 [bacterium HR19]|nr:hypothetical protein HRbin19_01278 [bacterium HR19]
MHEIAEMLLMIKMGSDIENQIFNAYDKMTAHFNANLVEYGFRKVLKVPSKLVEDDVFFYRKNKKLMEVVDMNMN